MSDQYVGEIRMFAGNFPPIGWAFCDGSTLPISGNEVLFTLLGTTYGGDGSTTFNLPDLRGRIPLHMGKNSLSGTTYTRGQREGTETVTLTVDQLPQHTHPANALSTAGTVNTATNAFWAGSPHQQYAQSNPDGVMNGASISSVGGNLPHENMMSFLAVSFIIAMEGIFPPQN